MRGPAPACTASPIVGILRRHGQVETNSGDAAMCWFEEAGAAHHEPDCAFSPFGGAASGDVVGFCDLGLAAVGARDVGPVALDDCPRSLCALGFMLTVIDQSTLRRAKVLISSQLWQGVSLRADDRVRTGDPHLGKVMCDRCVTARTTRSEG